MSQQNGSPEVPASRGDVVSKAEIEDLQDDALYFSRIKDIQEGLTPISEKLVSTN